MIKYKRVLLKLSGESLMGEQKFGIDPKMLQHYSSQIKTVVEMGVEVAIVIGGGNIFRGQLARQAWSSTSSHTARISEIREESTR